MDQKVHYLTSNEPETLTHRINEWISENKKDRIVVNIGYTTITGSIYPDRLSVYILHQKLKS